MRKNDIKSRITIRIRLDALKSTTYKSKIFTDNGLSEADVAYLTCHGKMIKQYPDNTKKLIVLNIVDRETWDEMNKSESVANLVNKYAGYTDIPLTLLVVDDEVIYTEKDGCSLNDASLFLKNNYPPDYIPKHIIVDFDPEDGGR
jgi:hypothetical protein